MYVEIRENKLLSYCENPYLDYEFVEIDYSTFDPEKYHVINGVLTDISATSEYLAQKEERENEILRVDLLGQVDELDKKRIRAIAEPQLKDAVKGQTWLEYYTLQIQELRTQIGGL
jgi:hypothetical protein